MAQPQPIRPAPTAAQPNKRLQQTQAQVDEVVDIMRVNVDKVLERDQKLTELDNRADALQAGASQFEASAGKLKRKYWWKNMKMMLLLGFVIVIVIILIGVWISEWVPTSTTLPSTTPPTTAGDKQSPLNPSSNGTTGGGGGAKTTTLAPNSTLPSSQG